MSFLTADETGSLAALSARLTGLGVAAPTRTRLTKTLGGGASITNPIDQQSQAPATWVAVVPVEGPFYAVRLGFASVYNYDWGIKSASIYPSDSYGEAPRLPVANKLAVVPTVNGERGPGAKVYFDHEGGDVETINLSGKKRDFRFDANPGNPVNIAKPFSIVWSDFVTCDCVPRIDGGPGYLLFIYITVETNAFTGTGSAFFDLAQDAAASRGRPIFTARAENWANDHADSPEQTGWSLYPSAPLFCVQYLSRTPGIQVAQTGDSLSVGPYGFSNALIRSTYDLSTPLLPIEIANFAWGGVGSNHYMAFTEMNAAAIRPSIFVPQPISRNDGDGMEPLRKLLMDNILLAERLAKKFGSKLLINGGGQEPGWHGNREAILGYTVMRDFLNSLPGLYGIPVFDCAAALGKPEAPWLFIDNVSDDSTHANTTGEELLVPLVRSALQKTIGSLPS